MTVWRTTCRAEIKLDPLGSAVEWEDSGTRCLAEGEERPSWAPVTPRPLWSVRREKVGEA
jgi:hypothetical protein